jgi:hypothetical protein
MFSNGKYFESRENNVEILRAYLEHQHLFLQTIYMKII